MCAELYVDSSSHVLNHKEAGAMFATLVNNNVHIAKINIKGVGETALVLQNFQKIFTFLFVILL